jgi:hypothetical protein
MERCHATRCTPDRGDRDNHGVASGRRANDAMVSAKPYVDTVNWTKGIHHEDFTHCDWLVSSNTHTITDLRRFTDIFIR